MCCILCGLSHLYIKEEKRINRALSTNSEAESVNLLISSDNNDKKNTWISFVRDTSVKRGKTQLDDNITE